MCLLAVTYKEVLFAGRDASAPNLSGETLTLHWKIYDNPQITPFNCEYNLDLVTNVVANSYTSLIWTSFGLKHYSELSSIVSILLKYISDISSREISRYSFQVNLPPPTVPIFTMLTLFSSASPLS